MEWTKESPYTTGYWLRWKDGGGDNFTLMEPNKQELYNHKQAEKIFSTEFNKNFLFFLQTDKTIS